MSILKEMLAKEAIRRAELGELAQSHSDAIKEMTKMMQAEESALEDLRLVFGKNAHDDEPCVYIFKGLTIRNHGIAAGFLSIGSHSRGLIFGVDVSIKNDDICALVRGPFQADENKHIQNTDESLNPREFIVSRDPCSKKFRSDKLSEIVSDFLGRIVTLADESMLDVERTADREL